MSILSTLFYFIAALLILVLIHEFGHFFIARMFNVKVLRFSFGFGKVLASIYDKKGTEYAFSLVPLGGYVKMLDETEGSVKPSLQHMAFNKKPVWVRIAVVLAGPLFNFIFAIFALWLVAIIGISTLAPIVGEVSLGSPADIAGIKSGHEVLSLANHKVTSWRDFQYALMLNVGVDEPLDIKLRGNDGTSYRAKVLPKSLNNQEPPDLLTSLGITPFIPKISMTIDKVQKGTPADLYALQNGDEIKMVNGVKVDDWRNLVSFISDKPGKAINITILRNQKLKTIEVVVGSKKINDKVQGYLGVMSKPWPKDLIRIKREGVVNAFSSAVTQTFGLTKITFVLIGKLITGKLPLHYLSGPVGIAQGAGASAQGGIVYYLSFLALISVSLGVLNILPIPMLDGGYLLFYLIEIVKRKPLSKSAQSASMYIGFFLLTTLMLIALGNDLSRLI